MILLALPSIAIARGNASVDQSQGVSAKAASDGGQPRFLDTFRPDERTHDFGNIREADGKVTHVFRLKNTGDKPVAISAVNTWCGCMVARYTKRAVRPGETAEVTVTLDPDHKQGNFVKQVVLLLNDGSQYVRLWVKANISPMDHPMKEDCPYSLGAGLYASFNFLPFPDLEKGAQHGYDLRLGNSTKKTMTVSFVRKPNNTVLKLPEKIILQPRERKTIRVQYTYPRRHKRAGYVDLVPIVNGHKAKPIRVQWSGGRKFKIGR